MKDKTIITRRLIFAVLLAPLAAAGVVPSRLFAGAAYDDLGFSSLSGPPFRPAEAVPAPPAAETYPPDIWVQSDKVYYIRPSQVDVSQVPPAPAAGSVVDNDDLASVRRWQIERTEAQCAAAQAQVNATYDEFFAEVSPFGNPTPGEVANIFQKARTDTGSVVYLQKDRYKRPRPFQRDPAITPCITKPGGYAYPSGHATLARVFGRMLSDLVPADSGKFMSYADQGALNRVIGGVHHPSDIEAGKKLGDAVYKALKQNSAFNTDMETLRQNLKP